MTTILPLANLVWYWYWALLHSLFQVTFFGDEEGYSGPDAETAAYAKGIINKVEVTAGC